MRRLLTVGVSASILLAAAACASNEPFGATNISPPSGSPTLTSGRGSSDTSRTSDFVTGRTRSGPIGSTTATSPGTDFETGTEVP